MTKNKTEETQQSVLEFLDAVPDEKKRSDGCKLVEIFQKETGFKPKMWGPSIIISMRVDMKETHLYLDFHLGRVPSHCI